LALLCYDYCDLFAIILVVVHIDVKYVVTEADICGTTPGNWRERGTAA